MPPISNPAASVIPPKKPKLDVESYNLHPHPIHHCFLKSIPGVSNAAIYLGAFICRREFLQLLLLLKSFLLLAIL